MTKQQERKTIEGQEFKCPGCGAERWVYLDDYDNGDWTEASYQCASCAHIEYVELPD
jgi:DNA-directed RNA polymerase subunit M/transcription elongation factor TFIIS